MLNAALLVGAAADELPVHVDVVDDREARPVVGTERGVGRRARMPA